MRTPVWETGSWCYPVAGSDINSGKFSDSTPKILVNI